ncbi:hypothetical protein GCM10027185_18780 [Spirosoma pulveris]
MNYGGIILLLIYTCFFDEVPASVAALLAITCILWYHNSVPSPIMIIGEMSYSLYLIHFPIGVKFLNLMNRYVDSSQKWVLFVPSLLTVLLFSWIFYKVIEKPFADISSKIKYRRILEPIPDAV